MGAQRMSLLAVSEAQKRLFALAGTVHAEEVPLAEAFGRWLGRDVKALRDQPWASLSAMDGYAIRHADLPGPWSVTRSEEHTSELQSLMRISYAVFCSKKKRTITRLN